MRCAGVLKTTVPRDIKARAKAIADAELLTEAAWLKRIVLREIRVADGGGSESREPRAADGVHRRATEARGSNGEGKPIYVRLRSGDRLLLDARAAARGLRPATYLSVLARSHLRSLAPLPKEEYLALKRSIGELAAIGRNINQIAKAANEGGRLPDSAREEFRAMLKICEALRVNTKTLLKANETSWSTGHG
ncbi:MAG: MobC family plasmid mobilization relaxosome protein [Gammaproteobacteria bacterium]|nr:MobC family plasmid mobilization relaxosome protein [Gammaproteobacteria bacterium]